MKQLAGCYSGLTGIRNSLNSAQVSPMVSFEYPCRTRITEQRPRGRLEMTFSKGEAHGCFPEALKFVSDVAEGWVTNSIRPIQCLCCIVYVESGMGGAASARYPCRSNAESWRSGWYFRR